MAWRAWDLKSPRPLSIDCLHSLPTSPAQTGSHARFYNTLYLHITYEAAKKKLNLIKKELVILNKSAVCSLEEGMEETLSLHPFWVYFQSLVSASRLPTVSKISCVMLLKSCVRYCSISTDNETLSILTN